ncbi:serine/threonine-protein kinase [Aliikangiella maris]|uniref:Protein kinase n=2 Tax=Aliikangiella maris TaxID=3162458 RepID=A0ABV2BV32_9GAMM
MLPVLDGYKIQQEIASGGMAKIYDAIQLSLNRSVAIKFLSRKLLSHPEAQTLFEHESLIIARLNHPNIVQIIDKGLTDESQPFFVMEKIIGLDLAMILEEGALPFNKKMDIAVQLCKGLAYAHKNGVIHRDIKPSNVIIDQHGHVKILDFGIALVNDEGHDSQTATSVMGTQGYVAPEQQHDYTKATVASDIYSLGILFDNLFNQSAAEQSSQFRSSTKALAELIKKCCATDPIQRYFTVDQIRDEILRISQGSHLGQSSIQSVESENKDLTNNFNLLDILDESKNKRVYLFQKKSNKQLFVIRRNFKDSAGVKEAKMLISLKHPNIINTFAAVKKDKSATIITEYLAGGSLSNQLIVDFSEQEFLKPAMNICSAIDYAHQNKILHKNLAPNNILFDSKQNPKVCDFGIPSNDESTVNNAYRPPANQAFSEQYDIYSMGAIFHHMLFGVPPNQPLPSNHQKISFRLQKLLDKMLALDPINRPTTAQECFIELKRIADLDANKNSRSTMGKQQARVKKSRVRPRQRANRPPTDHTRILSILLAIAVLCIIALVAKDFI